VWAAGLIVSEVTEQVVRYFETDGGVLGQGADDGLVCSEICVVPLHDQVCRANFLRNRDEGAIVKIEKVVDSLDDLEIPFAGAVAICEIMTQDEAAVTHEREILLEIVSDTVISMDRIDINPVKMIRIKILCGVG